MTFIDNKYTKWYNNIISNAKSRISYDTYVEIHHIIPRSLGGTNDENNLVSLSAREHFICHMLLPKMLTGKQKRQMSFAFWSMCNRHNTKTENIYYSSSRIYDSARKEFIIANKILHTGSKRSQATKDKISKGQVGRVGGMQNKHHSQETKDKISKGNTGKIMPPLTQKRKDQISKQFSGTKQSKEHKSKRVSSRQINGYYKDALATKEKMSESAKNRPKYKCQCGKECSPSNYKRWHGDNCKILVI
jgi:hypothetical protein